MQKVINTNQVPQTLKISVRVNKRPENICIRVIDAKNTKAVYEQRHQKVFGADTFFVKLPVTPKNAIVQVYNTRNGVDPLGQDKSFAWTMQPIALTRKILPLSINGRRAREFVRFAEDFSQEASFISAGYAGRPNSIYRSHDGTLRIDYYDVLTDVRETVFDRHSRKMVRNPELGQPVTSAMRTNAETGTIEVSKRYTVGAGWTIPMIIMVLLHEYSHFYVNTRPEDEEEADRNAAIIFLCMGYSKIAAHAAFIEVFKNADTPMNREREKKLYDFIEKFNMDNYAMVA